MTDQPDHNLLLDQIQQPDQVRQYDPLPLLRNVQYPTYQLYAVAGQGGTPPETVLTIAVLDTMQWLRKRFREFELPPELDWPESSSYNQVDCSEFTSFHINEGYKVEVIWLPEEKIWTLQLTEPDLGPQPGEETQGRAPVPGRIIETNIGYRVIDRKVECGFRTLVSEPVGTEQECEVYRLALIKHLARNPLVGLRHGEWALTDDAHSLEGIGSVKALGDWLADPDRMLPAVVFAENAPDAKGKFHVSAIAKVTTKVTPPVSLPALEEIGTTFSEKKGLIHKLMPGPGQQEEKDKFALDIAELTRYKMGYGQFFTLPAAQMETFVNASGKAVRPGDILIFEPIAFGGEVTPYPFKYTKQNPVQIYREIEDYIQNYPKNKPMTFGNVAFLTEAKEIDSEKLLNISQSKEELLAGFEEKLQAKNKKHEADLRKKGEDYGIKEDRLHKKLDQLNDRIRELELKNKELRKQIETVEKKHEAQLNFKDKQLARMQSLVERPRRPNEVAGWVEEHFAGRLIFHQRAVDEMAKIAPNKVDLDLVCNALEFLAMDYRDLLAGLIDEEEMNNRCTQKYGRPFDVVPSAGIAAYRFTKEYKIKYFTGPKGRLVESPLDYHLKVGTDNERLLRIYFLYDKEKRLIVVGSLPEHLPTVMFR